MPETCLITNKTKAILVLNLPHHVVPEHAHMGVVGVRVSTTKSTKVEGGRTFREIERKVHAHKKPISGSVTLLGRGRKGDTAEVARTAIHAPDVKAALARKEITIDDPEIVKADKAHKAKLAVAAAGEPAEKPSKGKSTEKAAPAPAAETPAKGA
jgi:hypothetical protein